MPTSSLRALADRLGILPSYVDNAGTLRETSDETRTALLAALGYEARDEEAAAHRLAALEAEEQSRIVVPVRVAEQTDARALEVRWPAAGKGTVDYEIVATDEASGTERRARGRGRAGADGRIRGVRLPALATGTYVVSIRLRSARSTAEAQQWLAVVPATCTPLAARVGRRRVFGLWANLYSVRSAEGLGFGNFGDAAALARFAGRSGGEFLGLNPLHALRNRGAEVSPYGPVSRLFRNPLYVDPTAVPELAGACALARLNDDAARRALARARAADRIDHEGVAAMLRPLLRAAWETLGRGADARRTRAFARYRERGGELLEDFATFCSIDERMLERGAPADWRAWPAELRDPRSPAVAQHRARYADDVGFHCFVQFELDRQLAAAARAGTRAGMAIGLYTDLAVGSLASGFDAWAFPGLLVENVSLGAPPDAYSAVGQDWSLPPLHPQRLRADGYRYWRLMLRSAFEHCGMLRLDHAMGVLRQFWIPAGRSGAEGAYVSFPCDDLLGLLALESRNAGALVVGEDLGTVPHGFSKLLARRAITSSSVMFFERTAGGAFLPSSRYSKRVLLTANTHDYPTLAGWRRGRDIEIRNVIGAFRDDAEAAAAIEERERDRGLLAARLRAQRVLARRETPATDADASAAVHGYLAAAPSPLLGVSLDDLAGEIEPVNVPGVSLERYPSWSRRMRKDLADLPADPGAAAMLAAVAPRARRRRPKRPARM